MALKASGKMTTVTFPTKAQAEGMIAKAGRKKGALIPNAITLTPGQPISGQLAEVIVEHCAMMVPSPGGCWEFSGANGLMTCGFAVPPQAGFAIVTLSGTTEHGAKAISVASSQGATSAHNFDPEAGGPFSASYVFDCAGQSNVGFTCQVIPGQGGIWISNLTVQYAK